MRAGRSLRVAISGAGIAGPALAYWLRRIGHEPTLIEKAPCFRTGGYIVDFWGVGYSVGERMGILPQVHRAGYSPRDLRLVDEHGRRVGGFSADVFRLIAKGRFTSLRRGDLARTISQALGDNAEVLFSNSVTALEEHAGGVRVAFDRGPDREFDLAVGADGVHSAVRRVAFGPEHLFEKPLGYRVAAFEVDGYEPRDDQVYVSHTTPGRQVARFALRDGRTVFFFLFADEHMSAPEPSDRADRTELLRRVFGNCGWECRRILDAMERAPEIHFDRVSQIRMERWSKGRVILIGDAAASVSLLAGEGAGLALTQAYVLAGELQRAGGDHREAFRRHELRLRSYVRGKQESAKSFASACAPKTALGVWLRVKATKLFSSPLAVKVVIGRDLRNDFALPNYEM